MAVQEKQAKAGPPLSAKDDNKKDSCPVRVAALEVAQGPAGMTHSQELRSHEVEQLNHGVVVSKQRGECAQIEGPALTNRCVWADNGTRAGHNAGVDVPEYVPL